MSGVVVLCADDYGLTPGIGESIRALAMAGRLSAVSCMANGPCWPAEAAALRALLGPLEGKVEIGLHLTLTELAPLGPMPRLAPKGTLPQLGALLARAIAGGLLPAAVRTEIGAEWQRQRAAFEAALGRPPDFVDGHQHVHQLPGARGVLLDLAQGWAARRPLWVRSCAAPVGGLVRQGVVPVRALVVALLGTGHRAALRRRGLPSNAEFRGVRGFAERAPYAALLERFLAVPPQPAPGPLLVMCHPGLASPPGGPPDAIAEARAGEHAFLASDGFPALLERQGLRLACFADAQAAAGQA